MSEKKRPVCINHCNPSKLNMIQKPLTVPPLHRTEGVIFYQSDHNFLENLVKVFNKIYLGVGTTVQVMLSTNQVITGNTIIYTLI